VTPMIAAGIIKAAGAGSTVLLASGGLQAVGATGGILGGIAGLIGTYLALRANARTARKEYAAEIEQAEKRGRDGCQPVIDGLRERLDTLDAQVTRLTEDRNYWQRRVIGDQGERR
jgi:hypothetical protein